nr:uncharacterized protein LOC129529605 isoform X3 [Gorilla gorilla gorilla]
MSSLAVCGSSLEKCSRAPCLIGPFLFMVELWEFWAYSGPPAPRVPRCSYRRQEFSHTVGELIEVHLRRQDSIPAFLSSLTLELFSRQTVA